MWKSWIGYGYHIVELWLWHLKSVVLHEFRLNMFSIEMVVHFNNVYTNNITLILGTIVWKMYPNTMHHEPMQTVYQNRRQSLVTSFWGSYITLCVRGLTLWSLVSRLLCVQFKVTGSEANQSCIKSLQKHMIREVKVHIWHTDLGALLWCYQEQRSGDYVILGQWNQCWEYWVQWSVSVVSYNNTEFHKISPLFWLQILHHSI